MSHSLALWRSERTAAGVVQAKSGDRGFLPRRLPVETRGRVARR
jgi:hypothetical protein